VTEWLPVVRVEVTSEAAPFARDTLPNRVDPSKNCTVPVAAFGDTVAANVTGCPALDGLILEEIAVMVATLPETV
jgi:hypothetical protein